MDSDTFSESNHGEKQVEEESSHVDSEEDDQDNSELIELQRRLEIVEKDCEEIRRENALLESYLIRKEMKIEKDMAKIAVGKEKEGKRDRQNVLTNAQK